MSFADTETSKGNCTYLPRDRTTGCPKPRSCRECLTKWGCMIGTVGICESDTLALKQYEYTQATQFGVANVSGNPETGSNSTTKQNWQFPQFAVGYCPVDDAVCRKCIDGRFGLPPSSDAIASDSCYCVGQHGCVCVANCELSTIQWPSCPAASASSSSSSSSSADGGSTVTIPPSADKRDNFCRYSSVDPATGCKTARQCDQCLRTPGCRIGMYDGFCEVDTYQTLATPDAFDFHLAFTRNVVLPVTNSANSTELEAPQHWAFPAFQATYCPANDTICLLA